MVSILRKELECFFAGLSFYTRIPSPKWVAYQPENLNKSRKYFALIGVLVGCFGASILWLCSLMLPLSVSVLLSMIATVYLTGAFHEDGFADSCDGFGGGWEKAQVLSIMKDSRMGSYGVVGLLLLFGLKFVVLWELSLDSLTVTLFALLLGHAVSRFMASSVMQCYEYVSHIETSKSQQVVSLKLSKQAMLFSFFPILGLLVLAMTWQYIVSLLFCCLITFGMAEYFKKRIGGYTGDCLGAVQQVIEVSFYLVFLAFIS